MNIIISNCSYEREFSMTEIMNPSINDSSGSWGLAETIEYESSNLFNLKIDLNMANFYLDEIKAQIVIMESFDSQWEGAAKDAYVDLKHFTKVL